MCEIIQEGSSGGPSGMTAEHLQPILENGRDAAALVSFATALAQGEVPQEALDGIRMGRITALSLTEVCEALWWVTFSDNWWRGPFQSSS